MNKAYQQIMPMVLASLFLTVSCNNKENQFTGQTNIGDDQLLPTPIPTPAPTPEPIEPMNCVDGIINTKLLSTKLISEKSSTQWNAEGFKTIKYEISLECEGERVGLKDLALSFDLNAIIDPFETSIDYRILSSDNEILSESKLDSVSGSDLFGNTGSYAHWKSNTIDITTNEQVVILEIDLSNFSVTTSTTGQTEVPTFLKIENVISQEVSIPLEYLGSSI